jgi:hypothetical protein
MWKSCLMTVVGLGLVACGPGEEFMDEPSRWGQLEQKVVQPVGPLQVSRGQHCSAKLPDGKVLFTGGYTNNGTALTATTEAYDPVTRTTSLRAPMNFARRGHECLSLRDGSVLVLGGVMDINKEDSVERYNPSTNTWTLLASMPTSNYGMASVQLEDGRVLVAGGSSARTDAFVFDLAANVWTRTSSLGVGRTYPKAIKLLDNRVLVLGGLGDNNRRAVEVYTPSTGTWATVAPLLADSGEPAAALLPDGRVFVGETDSNGKAQAQVYDASINTWTLLPQMNSIHSWGARMVLVNGEPVVAGGNMEYQQPQYIERFDFAQQRWNTVGALSLPRDGFTLDALADGSVLAAGGVDWGNSKQTFALMDLSTFSSTPPSSTEPLTYNASNTNSAQQNTVNRTFTLNAGDTLEVGTCNLTGASASGDTFLRLLGAGTQVAANDDSCGGTASYFQYTATTSGTYELRAGCYSSGSCGGTVVFRITSPTSPLTYTAADTNSAQQNTTNRSFKLNAGDSLEVGTCNLTGASASGDTYLRLFGAGTQVAFSDDSCGGTASFIQYTAPTAGTYELRAGCYSSTSCGGTVTFRITPAKP